MFRECYLSLKTKHDEGFSRVSLRVYLGRLEHMNYGQYNDGLWLLNQEKIEIEKYSFAPFSTRASAAQWKFIIDTALCLWRQKWTMHFKCLIQRDKSYPVNCTPRTHFKCLSKKSARMPLNDAIYQCTYLLCRCVPREISTANMTQLFITLHRGKSSLAARLALTNLSSVQRVHRKHFWDIALTKWQPSQLEKPWA